MSTIVAALRRFGRCFSVHQTPEDSSEEKSLGEAGEEQAARHLRRIGYKVLLRNVRLGRGEIDLVCREGEELVFVEVKTRTGDGWSQPAIAINARKKRALIHAAMLYLRELDCPNVVYRFDVVEVVLTDTEGWEINVIPNAFGSGR